MGIITKGMGAIMKLKKSRKVSDLKKAGKVPIKRKTIDKFGRERTNIDYAGGFKDFFNKKKKPKRKKKKKFFLKKKKKKKKNFDLSNFNLKV